MTAKEEGTVSFLLENLFMGEDGFVRQAKNPDVPQPDVFFWTAAEVGPKMRVAILFQNKDC